MKLVTMYALPALAVALLAGCAATTGLAAKPATDPDARAATSGGTEASDGDGECEDGVDAVTGEPCTDEDEEGEEGEEGDGDGECVDGVDAVTGEPCVDEDE